MIFFVISKLGLILFPNLADFYFQTWTNFISKLGKTELANFIGYNL